MRPDFAACGADFTNGLSSIYSQYIYNGSVQGILNAARPVLITGEGCRQSCGTGIEYYGWQDLSNRITTQNPIRKQSSLADFPVAVPLVRLIHSGLVVHTLEHQGHWQMCPYD